MEVATMSDVLVVDGSFVQSQAWANGFSSTLNGLCQKDYQKDYFSPDYDCIDLDLYEKKKTTSNQNDCTVDGIVGVAEYNNGRNRPKYALKVELKLDMVNPAQFKATNAESKITHSDDILRNQNCTSIYPKSYFLYPGGLVPQIKNQLGRYPSLSKKICPASVDEFLKNVVPTGSIQSKPSINPSDVKDSIQNGFNKGGVDYMLESVCYWEGEATGYSLHNNSLEHDNIVSALRESLEELKQNADKESIDWINAAIEDLPREKNSSPII